MKKIVLIKGNLMLSILLLTFSFSCRKDVEKEVFSCDQNVNKWAHDNYIKLRQIGIKV